MHHIKCRSDVKPVTAKLRRLPFLLRQKLSDVLWRLISSGVVETVDASDWVSPLLVVKKDDSIMLCVDVREANEAIVDGIPLPHIEERLQQLPGTTVFFFFSKLRSCVRISPSILSRRQ